MKNANWHRPLLAVVVVSAITFFWIQKSDQSVTNSGETTTASPTSGNAETTASVNTEAGVVETSPSPTEHHYLKFSVVDDPDPTAGDYLEAELTRKDGTAVDPAKGPLDLEYTLTLTGGETQIRRISVSSPAFNSSIGLGRNNANTEIQASDLQSVTVTVREHKKRREVIISNLSLSLAIGGDVSTRYSVLE